MIIIKIFDTHCDTAYELEKNKFDFLNGITHISKDQTDTFDLYEQVFAIWSNPKRTEEECWEHFNTVREYFDKKILPHKNDSFIPHLAVEGASLLAGKLDRLDILKEYNVKIITAVWKDECCMGGAHNTNVGLSSFGRDAIHKMFDLNITPDISHASDKMAYEIFEIANTKNKPIIASHSDSRKIRNHTRNLTDDMFDHIKKLGGIVGLNFCCEHLEDTDIKNADTTSIIRHLEHYLELDGENTVCLGCDFDGIESLPNGIKGVISLHSLYEELKKINYTDALIENVFYNNAHSFFDRCGLYGSNL